MRRRMAIAAALLVALTFSGCGGGGDAGTSPNTSGGSEGGSGGTPSTGGSGGSVPPSDFPVLVQGPGFQFDAITPPPEYGSATGSLQGRVLKAVGVAAEGGLNVQLLDTSSPASPTVIASTRTNPDGTFSLADVSPGLPSTDRWIAVTLPDSTVLRAYVGAWTQVTPASEVTVAEISRLRKAGAFTAHALTSAELASTQDSLTLAWQGQSGSSAPAEAIDSVRSFVRFHAPWNRMLDNLALSSPAPGGYDIAGLMPVALASLPASVVTSEAPAPAASEIQLSCHPSSDGTRRDCGAGVSGSSDFGDQLSITAQGIRLKADTRGSEVLTQILTSLGELPLIEFPYVVGTKVIVDQPKITLGSDENVHASVKITRRTYPADAVHAMGSTVQAVKIVFDQEISLLQVNSREQTDMLTRVTRWYTPQGGAVRWELTSSTRSGQQITSHTASAVATAPATGDFFDPLVRPFAGVADVTSLGLRHRHAVYSPSNDRVYVATDSGAPQLLELRASDLRTLRTLALPTVPGRLALSQDGLRLYAGLDGGTVVEIATLNLVIQSQFSLPSNPYGVPYDRVFDMAVDPLDSSRVLLIAGNSTVLGSSGALLTYRSGVLTLRDAPSTNVFDYGWGAYSPMVVTWTTTPNVFLTAFLGSPNHLYRMSAGASAYSDLVSLASPDNDIGLQDVGGEILTGKGRVLSTASLATLRSLIFEPFGLVGCNRLTTPTDLCGVGGSRYDPPFFVLLDHQSSAFLGTYRPQITDVQTGCPDLGVREGSFGLDGARLTPMGDGRVLVNTMPKSSDTYCGLQIWKLHGATP